MAKSATNPLPDLSVEARTGSLLGGRKDIRPVRTEWWGAGVVVCLDQGANDSYDLRINYMTYTLFLFQIISFKKYFYVSLGNNFFAVFLWRPLSCGFSRATAQFAPPLKSGHGNRSIVRVRRAQSSKPAAVR